MPYIHDDEDVYSYSETRKPTRRKRRVETGMDRMDMDPADRAELEELEDRSASLDDRIYNHADPRNR